MLPPDFETYTRTLLGEKLFSAFTKGMEGEAPVSIRLNPFKCAEGKYEVVDAEKRVPWCPNGYYLRKRPNFTFDPFLHAGLYYVQEASSMFIDYAVREILRQMGERGSKPLTVLDLCAAPGGKSTCMMSALPSGSVLYSNEPIRQRAAILYENICKFGHKDIKVTSCYARDYARSGMKFDIILTDVPCSGEGMFRKDAGAIADWSSKKVEQCAELQREIVSDIWSCLKPDGYLIYSTCTLNAHENEENVEWIARTFDAEHVDLHVEPDQWGIISNRSEDYKHPFSFPFYRFMPGRTEGEGLFVACLKRREEGGEWREESGESFEERGKRKEEKCEVREYTFDNEKKTLSTLHSPLSSKDKNLQSSIFNLQYPQAIAYLRGEAIVLPPDTPRGIIDVTFEGATLGKVKNIGNRANNLYPKEWRIKSTYIPDYEPIIVNNK